MLLTIKRLSLAMCVVLSILAVAADGASAAGKPTSVTISNTHELNGYNVIELTAKVNPNGASTAARFETRLKGGTTWSIAKEHTLSGTTIRTYSEELSVVPNANYEARVTATNLFGSTSSAIATVSTRVTTTGEKELVSVPFASSGVISFAFTWISIPISVVCHETSSGVVGTERGIADLYKYQVSGCTTYIHGEEEPGCEVTKNFSFILRGASLAIDSPGYVAIPAYECAPGDQWQIYPGAFRVADNGSSGEYNKVRPMSLTASGHLYSSNPAEITIESEWVLSAGYANTPFKVADIGL